ncbi:MAG TPA: ferritin-like domain-containing protein [Gammaproteobacteria bacterium]|nr:ferritin-like domain-containing protein [Gammaproteobacteria bacterium]
MNEPTRPDQLKPLPHAQEYLMNEEQLARYEGMFRKDYQTWAQILGENVERIKRGSYSLHWTKTEGGHWGKRAKPSSRGLTYTDINRIRGYGELPERADWFNFAPRGSIREPYRDRMPIVDAYTVLERDELWAENVISLYEEAKARQWNATKDIAWDELEALPEDLEKATCQLCTFLTEVEFVAGDFPAKWLCRTPQDFLEVKSFLTTQLMDEARHQEVFRKRAIAGGGLLHASPGFEWALKAILDAPTHTMGTFLLNLLGEGLVLSVFRSGEMIAKTQVDKEIFRRCLQDEARHVSYGVLELKNYLGTHKNREAATEEMHRFADVGEQVILTAFTEAALVEPVAVLLGGGLKHIDKGMEGLAHMWRMFIDEYLQRCQAAGFDRSARCTIPRELPWGVAA